MEGEETDVWQTIDFDASKEETVMEDSPPECSGRAIFADFPADRFVLKTVIGWGAYGLVWAVDDVSQSKGQWLACKELLKKNIRTTQDWRDVLREVKTLTLVGTRNHPNIVSFEGVFEDERSIYVMMNFCEGGDLQRYVGAQGFLSEDEAGEIFGQLLEGIQSCHSLGVIHRDLKPENVLLSCMLAAEDKDEAADDSSCSQHVMRVQLADFGLAVTLGDQAEAEGSAGSLLYEAPEVVGGGRYGKKADVWSLGVILHYLLSGSCPFQGETRDEIASKILHSRVDFGGECWMDVSFEARELICWLLSKDPLDRPSTVEIFWDPWVLKWCSRSRKVVRGGESKEGSSTEETSDREEGGESSSDGVESSDGGSEMGSEGRSEGVSEGGSEGGSNRESEVCSEGGSSEMEEPVHGSVVHTNDRGAASLHRAERAEGEDMQEIAKHCEQTGQSTRMHVKDDDSKAVARDKEQLVAAAGTEQTWRKGAVRDWWRQYSEKVGWLSMSKVKESQSNGVHASKIFPVQLALF